LDHQHRPGEGADVEGAEEEVRVVAAVAKRCLRQLKVICHRPRSTNDDAVAKRCLRQLKAICHRPRPIKDAVVANKDADVEKKVEEEEVQDDEGIEV